MRDRGVRRVGVNLVERGLDCLVPRVVRRQIDEAHTDVSEQGHDSGLVVEVGLPVQTAQPSVGGGSGSAGAFGCEHSHCPG